MMIAASIAAIQLMQVVQHVVEKQQFDPTFFTILINQCQSNSIKATE